jgi:hypothetical protein
MKPNQKLADIKKNAVVRNPSSKAKASAQRNSPYNVGNAGTKPKHHKQGSEEISFKPIMVTFIPSAHSEVILKPDYPMI